MTGRSVPVRHPCPDPAEEREIDRAALLDHVDDPDGSKDFTHSIGSAVVRCRYEGARAVAVGADADTKTQINALVDLLDLHLSDPGEHPRTRVDPDRLVLLLGGRPKGRWEAVDALARLAAAQDRYRIEVREPDGAGGWRPTEPDLGPDPRAAGYVRLLDAVHATPPALVSGLMSAVDRPELRAYPMLSSEGKRWSLRVEGLQVGEVSATSGWLDIGTPAKPGRERQHWQARTGWTSPFLVDRDTSPAAAVGLRSFADTWLAVGAGPVRQDEHALESRVLRGAVAVEVDGQALDLLQDDPHVNWGSQFPNRWGRDGRARYLDGLLRAGATPWALEMKVQVSSGGLRQYYRHGVVQAVLYREYILRNGALDAWFSARGLDRSRCRAALVVPELPAGSAVLPAVRRVCDVFDVALVQVPHAAAELSPAVLPPEDV